MLWFTVFGGTGINLQQNGVDIAGTGSEAAGFFVALQQYPLFTAAAVAAIVLICTFFVTGADPGALVLGTLSTSGSKEPWTPVVVFWAALSGVVAAVLLLVGGLQALQTFTILAASPFILVMIGLCVAMYADLRRDPLRQRSRIPVRCAAATPSSVPFSDAAMEADDRGDGDPATEGRTSGNE
ncbi:BCCT family transporter [Arthrobacter sp. H14]|uniref:BCCT family transporter n=1 Tax=Arthrobacter sp. H14 TaxID=1312959 RepID=UPI0020A669EB|nr:BCCT family transporter [Arthrobacter sp. H14]